MDRLQLWHAKLTDKNWLQPKKPTTFIVILIFLAGLVAAGMNGYARYWQYDAWKKNSQIFYLDDGTPLFTTTDAPYFLGLAQSIKKDGNFQTFNEKRQYPLKKDLYDEIATVDSLRDAPLLSVVLSIMAGDYSTKSLLIAGNKLVIITAILSAAMIFIGLGATGYWMEASVAAAGGGLSIAYYARTGAGRIDTDQLNLGFFYLMSGLVIWASHAKKGHNAFVLAALAGAVFWIFDWWYSKPVFGWAFFVGFVWLSFTVRRDLKHFLIQAVLFLGLSGLPFKSLEVASASQYLFDSIAFEGMKFPNSLSTVTELTKISFLEILKRISGSIPLGLLSVFGLGLWMIRHPALAICLGPAAAFALLNFLIGNRAIFYSAPIIWFGLAWVILTLAKYIEARITHPNLKGATLPISLTICFFVVWLASPTNYLQSPTFDKTTVSHFQKLDDVIPKENVVIVTWWDYGYSSIFFNGRPTIHDGGTQTSPARYFIANNLVQKSQKRAASELHLMGSGKFEELMKNRLQDRIQEKDTTTEVYLVLTEDMTNWMPSISKIGAFDIREGKHYQFAGVKPNYRLGYSEIKCEPTNSPQEYLCDDKILNTTTGELGNGFILSGITISSDGRQTSLRKYRDSNTPFIWHSEIGAKVKRNLLLHRDLYTSVFHQLYYLGKPDPRYFELVYDGFPKMRVFKVL